MSLRRDELSLVQARRDRGLKRQFDPADPEWMDRPQPVSAELLSDLRNLRALNRYFGSYRLVRYFLRRWIRPGDRLRILDLATGSGDIPRLVVAVRAQDRRGSRKSMRSISRPRRSRSRAN